MRDEFYTPPEIVDAMLAAVRLEDPGIIADFAAGDGRLLRAASERWSGADIVATDIDRKVAVGLRVSGGWLASQCDFLNGRSRSHARALSGLRGHLSLALLNPPFSNRGATRFETTVCDQRIACGRAMAFVLGAASYLSPGGELVAIMPAGSMVCERDDFARKTLNFMGSFEVLATFDRNAFRRCFPRTMLVRFRRSDLSRKIGEGKHVEENSQSGLREDSVGVAVIRGTLQVHKASEFFGNVGAPFVHSTALRDNQLHVNGLRIGGLAGRRVTGPAVLLPRVGQPSKSKLATHLGSDSLVLSDCVIGLSCSSPCEAEVLFAKLLDDWREIEAAYGGTGSQYITVRNLVGILRRMGFNAITERVKRA